MHGADVRELQEALKAKHYLGGRADGVYGMLTAQAVFRAKFWLGYAKPDQRAGAALYRFLTDAAEPSKEMKARRAKRVADAKKKPPAKSRTDKIIDRALSKVGVTEDPPGSNIVEFSKWYGIIGAWCAMFVTWSFVTAGFSGRTFRKGTRYSFVPTVVSEARLGRNGLVLAHGPDDAVLACYDWQHDGTADHIGICASEDTLRRLAPKAFAAARKTEGALGAGDFWAVEGNTAVGNDSNGGEVMIRRRNVSQVRVFARVVA